MQEVWPVRTLNRNKQPFWYALYRGSENILNASGQYTGQKRVIYSDPVKAYGNISAATGDALTMQFGINVDYDNVIVMDSTDMDESSILWIGVDTDKPYNYIVRRVSRSLNSVAIAIRQVDVNA